MLQPKKIKYPKSFKGKTKGIARKATTLSFGQFGLKSMGTRWISSQQIEASRLAVVRTLKKKDGKLWIRIFPFKPITSKGSEASMGGGKGKLSYYAFPVKPGRIMFELGNVTEEEARKAFKKVASKLPVKTKFIKKD